MTPRRWLVTTLAGKTVGDHQLRLFKADPSRRGLLMDRGLLGLDASPIGAIMTTAVAERIGY
jgi:hypothetical protein